MTVIRGQVLLAGTSEKLDPRHRITVSGVQVVRSGGMWWAKKPAFLRNIPWTAVSPHLGQLETRIHFGHLAKEAKATGRVGTRTSPYRGFVGAAGYIQETMKGYRAADRMDPEEYPSRRRRTIHTLEELERMLEEKTGRPLPAPARG